MYDLLQPEELKEEIIGPLAFAVFLRFKRLQAEKAIFQRTNGEGRWYVKDTVCEINGNRPEYKAILKQVTERN